MLAAVRAGKGFNLFVLNEYRNDIIRIVNSIKNLALLMDSATETVKHEIKKQKSGVLPPSIVFVADSLIALMTSSLIQPVAPSLVKGIFGKRS